MGYSGYYGNSRGEAEDLIKEGLRQAGGRSADRGLASRDDVGAELLRRSEERIARQRAHQAGDDKPTEELTAREMILRGLAQADGRNRVVPGRPQSMGNPPQPGMPRR